MVACNAAGDSSSLVLTAYCHLCIVDRRHDRWLFAKLFVPQAWIGMAEPLQEGALH